MAEAVDYFSNHRLKLRFPWRLYHGPIVRELAQAVAEVDAEMAAAGVGAEVLNVGSGPFFELDRLPKGGTRYTVCDIDPRAIDAAKQMYGARIERALVVTAGEPLAVADASFDLVVSMDVIEHVPDPAAWLADLVRVTKPGGRVMLTTPNYGWSTLGLLERTALEAIARAQGFSRKDLHPSKFDRARLVQTMHRAGLEGVRVRRIAFGWVLVGTGRVARETGEAGRARLAGASVRG